MPLINGICVPPICLDRALIVGGAKLMLTQTVGGVAGAPRNVSAVLPALLKKGINELTAAKDVDCDGCNCFKVKRWNPPLNMVIPPYAVETNTSTDPNGVVIVDTYEIVGATYLLKSVGICYPPGTKVQVGGQWVPVEGKKGKAEKKKKKKTSKKNRTSISARRRRRSLR
jgi:hypothetical protein